MRGATPLSHAGHLAAFAPLPARALPDAAGAAGFAAGTAILTTEGEVLAEHLIPGDTAILANGATAQIRRITRQRGGTRLVRIQRGALGRGLPTRPLILAPDQPLLLGHVLVRAADLIDNATILPDHASADIELFAIELATQAILLADGAPAESAESGRETPLCQSGPTLAALRARLAARNRGFGLIATETLALSARAAYRALTPLLNASREASFAIPAGATELFVTTPTFTPADFDPASADRRKLGLALAAVSLDGRSMRAHALAISGLHTPTPADPQTWTTGRLRLNLPPGTRKVSLHIAARPKTWQFNPKAAA